MEKSLEAGKPQVSLDTLFNLGKPYCLFVEEEKVLGTFRATVKELNGNEVLWIRYQDAQPGISTNHYEVTFVRSGNKAMVPVD